MKVFGFEITPDIRDDIVFVLAVSLLILGGGEVIRRAVDNTGSIQRLERFEQRLRAVETSFQNDAR